jgi:site-specific recombinase XerD
MRHTYATDLYAAGVDEKAQKVFLGHASSDVTDIYRKMNEAAFLRALQQLNDYYNTLDFVLENYL